LRGRCDHRPRLGRTSYREIAELTVERTGRCQATHLPRAPTALTADNVKNGHLGRPTEETAVFRKFLSVEDIREDVRRTIGSGAAATADVDSIVSEIVQTVGVDGYSNMDQSLFWAIVSKYDDIQL
jgi:hypothetical protein